MSKISENIIIDLLPLYYSKHASKDTLLLVDDYFAQNKEFAYQHKLPVSLDTPDLELPDELSMLKTTRFYLMMRSLLLYLAVFTSFVPLAFGDVSWIEAEGMTWLWVDTPEVAILAGIVAIVLWVLYGILNSKLKVTKL